MTITNKRDKVEKKRLGLDLCTQPNSLAGAENELLESLLLALQLNNTVTPLDSVILSSSLSPQRNFFIRPYLTFPTY